MNASRALATGIEPGHDTAETAFSICSIGLSGATGCRAARTSSASALTGRIAGFSHSENIQTAAGSGADAA